MSQAPIFSSALQRLLHSDLVSISFITSVISLITGATALSWQFIDYMKGPDVVLIAPEQVTIGSSDEVHFPLRASGRGPYVHFIIRMSYVNKGAVGYNSTVKLERLRVKVADGVAFEYHWFRFVTSDSGGPDGWDLKVEKIRDAAPFPITAGTAVSQETLFQPWPRNCKGLSSPCLERDYYVTWESFIQLLAASAHRAIEFETVVELYERVEPILAKCFVKIDDLDLAELRQHHWKSPVCASG